MPITSLDAKKCLITGAASGIGMATAIAAAREGAELFLTDIRAAALEQTTADIRRDGGRVAMAQPLDVADFEAVREFAAAIHSEYGGLDVVMNVAGISVWGAVETLDHEHWRRAIDIDLMGPIHVIECFVPPMVAAGRGGHLVNVSSAAGLFGLPWHAAYSAAKFGLRGVSEVLRFDLARHGIGVSLVCPGGVDTGLVETVEIVGLDTANPDLKTFKERFQKKAVTPEKAAAALIKGIKANRYLVFTSFDIRLLHWFQRKFAAPYEWVMKKLNDQFHAIYSRSRTNGANKQSRPGQE